MATKYVTAMIHLNHSHSHSHMADDFAPSIIYATVTPACYQSIFREWTEQGDKPIVFSREDSAGLVGFLPKQVAAMSCGPERDKP